MKSVLKKILSFFIKPYFLLRKWYPVWFYVLNYEPRKLYKKDSTPPSPLQERIIKDIKENGIAVTHLNELFPGENKLQELLNFSNPLLKNAVTREGKPFLKKLWDDDLLLESNNPFIQLLLSDEIISVASGYMDMYPKNYYSSLDLTIPVGESDAIRSQNWHRDPEDKKICKVFVYLYDIDENAGPFTYAKKSHYGGKWDDFYPQKPPKGSYPPAGSVEKKIPDSDISVMTGKAGTVIFCDTAGLHKGGYAKSKERLMFTTEFSSKASLRPIRYTYPKGGVKEEFSNFSPMAKYALKNDFGLIKLLNIPLKALKYGIY